MATETAPRESLLEVIDRETSTANQSTANQLGLVVLRSLKALASLKLTVSLFALAIFLVLAGTLAQHRKEIVVIGDEQFRRVLALLDHDVLTLLEVTAFLTIDGDAYIGTRMNEAYTNPFAGVHHDGPGAQLVRAKRC